MAMEQLVMFCIYDCKMELYMAPYTAMNTAVAVRIFETAVLREGTDFNSHPDDYSLWQVGTFDQETGGVETTPSRNVVQAHHITNKYKNQNQENS